MTAPPALPNRPASLPLRLAAMVYDAVLLFGVVFIVSYALLALFQWKYPLPPGPRTVLQGVLFLAIGGYFVWCWSRSGQTLALKTWSLQVVGDDGRPPTVLRSSLRYVLAWHLWVPGLLWVALFRTHVAADLGALAIGCAVLLLPALGDARRRLLHDRWTKTCVVRLGA